MEKKQKGPDADHEEPAPVVEKSEGDGAENVDESVESSVIDSKLQFQLKQMEYRLADSEKKLAEYEKKFGEAREYVKRMEGEVQDIRVRAQRDLSKAVNSKIGSFFVSLLQISDNIERSLAAASDENSSLSDGIRLVHQQFQEFFKREGLERIPAKGKKFDPHFHEALISQPVDADLDGVILEELKPGYTYKETVIRPAQVIVGTQRDDQ